MCKRPPEAPPAPNGPVEHRYSIVKTQFRDGPQIEETNGLGKPRTRAPIIHSDDKASLSTKAVSPKVHCVQIRACGLLFQATPVRTFGHLGMASATALPATAPSLFQRFAVCGFGLGHGICNGLASSLWEWRRKPDGVLPQPPPQQLRLHCPPHRGCLWPEQLLAWPCQLLRAAASAVGCEPSPPYMLHSDTACPRGSPHKSLLCREWPKHHIARGWHSSCWPASAPPCPSGALLRIGPSLLVGGRGDREDCYNLSLLCGDAP